MATISNFSYHPHHSLLHQFDARLKLISLIFFNFICFQGSPIETTLVLIPVLGIMQALKIPFKNVFREIRFFLFLLAFIITTRSFFSIDSNADVVKDWIYFSSAGLKDGLLLSLRLFCVVLLGLLFVFSTTSRQITQSLEWFLQKLPGLPARRLAVMLGLMIRFIPLILNLAAEISEAQQLRGSDQIKNPIRRLFLLTVPLFRKTLTDADHVATAMVFRGYQEKKTIFCFNSGLKDFILFAFLLIYGMLTLLVEPVFNLLFHSFSYLR